MLTVQTIQKALRDAKASGADVWITDQTKARGIGRLRLRARPSDAGIWYYRYSDPEGKQVQLSIGAYDAKSVTGLSLKEARDKAGELSKQYQDGHRDLRAHLEHQQAEEAARIETAKRAREEAARKAKSGSLKALLQGYSDYLKAQGKQSAKDVAGLFRLHVLTPPEIAVIAEMRAASITHRDITRVVAQLTDAGKGRTAAKLRSYISAAYAAALQAEGDPTIPTALHGFDLTGNPASVVSAKSLAKYNRARERVLNEGELKAFLAALERQPGLHADAIMLLLLLGGQRPAQLLRVRRADVDLDGKTITLFDGKGARQHPRAHVLPLTDRAVEIIKRHSAGEFLLSTFGKVPLRAETITKAVTEISTGMVKRKEAREPFQLRDLRRTCETMLAGMGISRDVRAQLLSHGLGGVQQKHYDRHEYMNEKRHALGAWDRRLKEIAGGEKAGNVVALRGV
jgi:integrase